jgi:preprotein translocase subunit SecD
VYHPAPMRRALPILIVLVGLVALVVDFVPGLTLPFGGPDGSPRTVETKLGLDLEGGLRVVYQAQPVEGKAPTQADMAVIRDIMEQRVNAVGVAEPVVQTQGADRIVVELPGVDNPQVVRDLVGQTGRVEFVPIPPGSQVAQGQAIDLEQYPPLFSGDQVSSAAASTDQFGGLAVAFTLKSEGAALFADYTSNNVGNQFAIVLDGTIVSASSPSCATAHCRSRSRRRLTRPSPRPWATPSSSRGCSPPWSGSSWWRS